MRKDPEVVIDLIGDIDVKLIPSTTRTLVGEAIFRGLLEASKDPAFWAGFEEWKMKKALPAEG